MGSGIDTIYQRSVERFNELRQQHERLESKDIGGRPFVLVEAMNSDLLSNGENQQNHLTILLDTAYGRYDDSRPLHKPGEIHDSLPIFYTLLDLDRAHLIHHFKQHEPPLRQLPIELDVLKTIFPRTGIDTYTGAKFEQLAEDIYNRQWYWCPLIFNHRMNSELGHHERRIPITARSRIEPARDGVQKEDPKAKLWIVEIPVECVGHDLKEALERNGSAFAFGDEPRITAAKAKTYKLVIKQFTKRNEGRFSQERDIFHFIRENQGIVQYFGWYKHCEKDVETGEHRIYYNLVLERGTQDLYSAFQKENPPITYCEIQVFWSSLFDVAEALASIQVIDAERLFKRYVWHGDIKPENILDVQGRFKLADPGEACVETVSKDPRGHRDIEEIPRTQVPGGTVTFAAPEKNAHRMEGTKEIPLVTQGIDIWSLGCVFSVAATYVVAGKEGVKQYRLLRQRAISKLGQGYGDAFHDTRKVLPEVTQWHKYLRTSTRAQDTFTSKVLNIVDEFMLIVPGEARISGSKLSSTLKKINEDAQSQNQDQQQPPDDILNFLDEVMRLTVPERATSLALEEIPRTISQSGASMFEEALLYRSMRSEGRIPMRKLVAPETVETQLASNLAEQQPFVTSHHPSSQHIGLGYSNLPEYTTSLPQSPNEPMSFDDPPVTFWEVEAQLIQHGTKRSIPGIKMLNKRVSVHGKTLDGKNDQLMVHFKNRDLVYLVDNAATMFNFWKHATYLLRILVWRSLGYDDDGMELVFTKGDPSLGLKPSTKKKQAQNLDDFTKKMDEAIPKPEAGAKTDMKASLEAILGAHMKQHREDQKMKRELTVLVLTDGLWEANDEYDVDEYLVSFIKTNKASWGWNGDVSDVRNRRRPISVEFIRFGHHPKAIARLRRLDDDLKNRPELSDKEIPDMIDTENADGDVYKMFLGSFLEDMDNKLIQGGASTGTISSKTLPASQRMSYASEYSPFPTQPPNRSVLGSPSPTTNESTPRITRDPTINTRHGRSFSQSFFNTSSMGGEATSADRSPSPGDIRRWETYSSRHYP